MSIYSFIDEVKYSLDNPKVNSDNFSLFDNLVTNKMAIISLPRLSGKTQWLVNNIRRGDLVITFSNESIREFIRLLRDAYPSYHAPSYPDIVTPDYFKDTFRFSGVGNTLPCRYVFFDEVEPDTKTIEKLIFLGIIDKQTSVISLLTKTKLRNKHERN